MADPTSGHSSASGNDQQASLKLVGYLKELALQCRDVAQRADEAVKERKRLNEEHTKEFGE